MNTYRVWLTAFHTVTSEVVPATSSAAARTLIALRDGLDVAELCACRVEKYDVDLVGRLIAASDAAPTSETSPLLRDAAHCIMSAVMSEPTQEDNAERVQRLLAASNTALSAADQLLQSAAFHATKMRAVLDRFKRELEAVEAATQTSKVTSK